MIGSRMPNYYRKKISETHRKLQKFKWKPVKMVGVLAEQNIKEL